VNAFSRVARYPAISFLVLTFLFSLIVGIATLWLAGAFLPRGIVATHIGRAGVVFGPAVAALIVTRLTAGRGGVALLLSGLKPYPGAIWWMVVLPAFAVLATGAAYVATGTPRAAVVSALADRWPLLIATYALQVLTAGVGEEIGWRGWLLPRLLSRYTPATATVLVAIGWGLWHLPILIRGGWMAMGFVVTVFALSFLFTALRTITHGSILVIAFAHAAHNTPFFFFETTLGWDRTEAAWLAMSGLYAAMAVAVAARNPRWWRQRV
jgi:membrane protease YdiL (CAAX protease family)